MPGIISLILPFLILINTAADEFADDRIIRHDTLVIQGGDPLEEVESTAGAFEGILLQRVGTVFFHPAGKLLDQVRLVDRQFIRHGAVDDRIGGVDERDDEAHFAGAHVVPVQQGAGRVIGAEGGIPQHAPHQADVGPADVIARRGLHLQAGVRGKA